MNDYRVKITIRNDRILSKIEELGYVSVLQFCKQNELQYQHTSMIISGKVKPFLEKRKQGQLTSTANQLLQALDMTVEEAFTEKQLKGFAKNSYEIKVKEQELLQLVNPVQNLEMKVIEKDIQFNLDKIFSKYLSPRYETVLRMRYGIGMNTDYTLEEIGLKIHPQASRERVRQIEKAAIRKLQHPAVLSKLINTGFNDVFTKVDLNEDHLKKQEMHLFNEDLKNKKLILTEEKKLRLA
jgi:hypothetical protein